MASARPTERCAANGRWQNDRLGNRARRLVPLLRVWARRELRVRYRQSTLGVLWSLVQPLAIVAIYGVVLQGLLDIGTEGAPYLSFAWAGMAPWAFTSSALSVAIPSTLTATSLIGKAYFPREVIPLAAVCASTLDLAIANIALLLILEAQGVGLSPTLLGIVPAAIVLILYVASACVFGAAITVFARDVRHALPVALQLAFFASPIAYSTELYPERFSWLSDVNPIAVVVEASRATALHHQWPRWDLLLIHAVVGTTLLLLSVAYTRSVEPRIVDLV